MTISASSSAFAIPGIGATSPFYTFSEMCRRFKVSPMVRDIALARIQMLAKKIEAGALKTSCSVDGSGEYFRKSVNHLSFPVFRNDKKENYVILKTQLSSEFYSKGFFARGLCKVVYCAIKLGFGKCSVEELAQHQVYAWGRSRILNCEEEHLANGISKEPEYYRLLNGNRSVEYFGHCQFRVEGEDKNDELRIGIMMEFCRMDLFDFLHNGVLDKYDIAQMKTLIKELLLLLQTLEDHQKQHHDIKLENIMIDASGRLKLSDYNLMMDLSEVLLFKGISGSSHYALPEECSALKDLVEYGEVKDEKFMEEKYKLFGEDIYSTKGDIFMMGFVIFYMCFGRHPFEYMVEADIPGLSTSADDYIDCLYTHPESTNKIILNNLRMIELEKKKNYEFVPLIRGMIDFIPLNRFSLEVCLKMINAFVPNISEVSTAKEPAKDTSKRLGPLA